GTVDYAADFMEIILIATPISYIFIGLNNMMRATGYPRKAMISALLSVAANIILAPIFIFVFDWGIRGAAFATICSQGLALIWVLQHFFSKNSFIHFKQGLKWIDSRIVKRIYGIGLSPFLMNVCACIVVIFINKALLVTGKEYGDLAIGAFGIINRTAMLFVMIVFGVTQGMQPILGYNYGANQWDRVKKTLKIGIYIGVSITTFGWIVCELMPDAISSLFTTDKTLISIANTGFRLSFIFWPLIGVQMVIQNFFQSIGKPKISIFLSLTRQMIFLLPFLLIFPGLWGINGVWLSMSVSDGLACVLSIGTLIYQYKILNARFNLKTE
ncbi:MAG: MATE family efflux transporter, partial [Muribaculaceae bacterium]